MPNTAISVSDLSKKYDDRLAVSHINFEVPLGIVCGFVGPNGAGKTTLFVLLSGFLLPDHGRVIFEGHDITGQEPHLNAKRGMTRTFQIVQPFAAQTVRENIAVGAHLHTAHRKVALEWAQDVAQRVGLAPQMDKLASDLTVAGRKRLELARALATQPKLLLLDEVLAGLNPQEITEMIPVLHSIGDSGVTIVMIEHVMQAVMSLAEHVWVLAQGQLIAQGSPSQVTSHPQVIEAYLGHGTAARLRQAQAPLTAEQTL